MVTSHVMTGRHIAHFALNSALFIVNSFGKIFHTLPHHGNDIARHFELVKSQGCSDNFSKIL